MYDAMTVLNGIGIQPTPQRIAVVEIVLTRKDHYTADEVLELARKSCPTVSRATVYNTLNLLAEKGVLTKQLLKEGTVVFDSNINEHHHLVDGDTGEIIDIPWNKLEVRGMESLTDFEVEGYQVIVRGRRRKGA